MRARTIYPLDNLFENKFKKLETFLWFDTGVLSIKSSNYDTKCFQEIRRRKMFFKKEDISLEPAKIEY